MFAVLCFPLFPDLLTQITALSRPDFITNRSQSDSVTQRHCWNWLALVLTFPRFCAARAPLWTSHVILWQSGSIREDKVTSIAALRGSLLETRTSHCRELCHYAARTWFNALVPVHQKVIGWQARKSCLLKFLQLKMQRTFVRQCHKVKINVIITKRKM